MNCIIVPEIIDYPELFEISCPMFSDGMLCYFIDPYPMDGVSVYIGIKDDYLIVRVGDWTSNNIDLSDVNDNLKSLIGMLIEITKTIHVSDVVYYLSSDKDKYILVDMMISPNKFAGPGMLRDIFSKVIDTQVISGIDVLSPDSKSKYKGKIVKPSRFRTVDVDNIIRPLYGFTT